MAKLLFLVSSLEGGGAERIACVLCNAWAKSGHDVTLMATFSGRGSSAYTISDRVLVDHLADHVNGSVGRIRRLLALGRRIRAIEPDIVISFLPLVNIAAILGTLGTRIPVIICERIYPPAHSPPLTAIQNRLRQWLYPWADAIVGQTNEVRDWLKLRFPTANVQVVANPVTLPLPKTPPALDPAEFTKQGRHLILAVGRLDPQKRFNLLLDAFQEIAGDVPDWDLAILGAGPEHPRLEQQILQLALSGRVLMPGFSGNLGDWYNRADLFVLPSESEGFPNAMLEAMAHGMACIAFDVKTGPADISNNGQRAVLLKDSNHIERLADAMKHLITHKSDRHALGQRAMSVSEDYSGDNILQSWDELIASVIGPERWHGI